MIFKGLEVTQTGLSVQKYRLDIISSNLANANSVTDVNSEPYRRKIPVFEEILDKSGDIPVSKVVIKEVIEDPSPAKLKYEPNNPLADENGYVKLPNVDPLREMVDMISAMRTYEANLTAFNTHKGMLLKTIDIIRV
jgi:flagellar basal-body rod protein FlgC